MTKASDNEFPSVLFDEQPSDVSTPATGFWRAFFKSDGMYVIDDAGTVTGPFGTGGGGGDVATDPIWDAAGDLVVGTGANAAARLAIGATNGMDVRRVSGAVAWAFPPGHTLDYTTFTSPVTINQSAIASAVSVVSASAIAFDGSTVVDVEFYCMGISTPSSAGVNVQVFLFDGSTSLGCIGYIRSQTSSGQIIPMQVSYRLTPSNASHTYSIKGTSSTGSATANAGSGGATLTDFLPGHIKITIA